MKKEKINSLTSELKSDQEVLVLKALKSIRKSGSEKLIQVMVDVMHDNNSDKIKQEILQLFYDLKDSKCVPELVLALDSEKGIPNRAIIMSVFWQAGMNPAANIDVFTRIAVDGDYMEALEALTVIENLEGPFEEHTVLESLLKLKTYLDEDVDEEKKTLISTIQQIVLLIDQHL